MQSRWVAVEGRVIEGHRVASRASDVYPYGTIEKQKPHFEAAGLDLADCFNATLNISIAPLTFAMTDPEFTFERVEWTDLHPPETFSFSRCEVAFKGKTYDGWVYYPHPETKERHFQNPTMIEVLAPLIPGISYGDRVHLHVDASRIHILGAG